MMTQKYKSNDFGDESPDDYGMMPYAAACEGERWSALFRPSYEKKTGHGTDGEISTLEKFARSFAELYK